MSLKHLERLRRLLKSQAEARAAASAAAAARLRVEADSAVAHLSAQVLTGAELAHHSRLQATLAAGLVEMEKQHVGERQKAQTSARDHRQIEMLLEEAQAEAGRQASAKEGEMLDDWFRSRARSRP